MNFSSTKYRVSKLFCSGVTANDEQPKLGSTQSRKYTQALITPLLGSMVYLDLLSHENCRSIYTYIMCIIINDVMEN